MQIILAILRKLRKTILVKINKWQEWFEMKKFRRMEKSRNDWKNKAGTRATVIREIRKARIIEREKINLQQAEIRQLKLELKKKPTSHHQR